MTQALDPTGGLLSGGGLSFGVSFSSFKSRSDWTQTLASSLSAGGTLTLTSGADLTLSGSTATGGTTNVTVGGNLTVASVQDTASSSSSSTGVSLSVGAGGVGFGVNGSKSQSNSRQTNALATITSTSGPTNVTVGGNTNLVGGAITSSGGATNLTTGTLTASSLNDSKTSSSSSFGVTIGANPGLSFSQANANRLGLTFSVVGEGAITLTAPGADTSVLATLKRDPSGRQIVTVDDHSGFSVDVSLSDFQALANVATSAGNFLSALTSPLPDGVSSAGPAAVTAYRGLSAFGGPQADTEDQQTALINETNKREQQAEANDYYAPQPTPETVTAAIADGATFVTPTSPSDPVKIIASNADCDGTSAGPCTGDNGLELVRSDKYDCRGLECRDIPFVPREGEIKPTSPADALELEAAAGSEARSVMGGRVSPSIDGRGLSPGLANQLPGGDIGTPVPAPQDQGNDPTTAIPQTPGEIAGPKTDQNGGTIDGVEYRFDESNKFSVKGDDGQWYKTPEDAASAPLAGSDVPRGDPRNTRGTVTSDTSNLPQIKASDDWLRGTDSNAGRIPAQIAEQLNGRSFASFDDFRAAFWTAVGNDPILSGSFSPQNRQRMLGGLSPFAIPSQQVGGRQVYELDHMFPIAKGGEVYDLNNLVVRTPYNHIKKD